MTAGAGAVLFRGVFPRTALFLALALPTALHAHLDFTLPVGQVTATPLPAAPLGSGAWRFEVQAGWARVPADKARTWPCRS